MSKQASTVRFKGRMGGISFTLCGVMVSVLVTRSLVGDPSRKAGAKHQQGCDGCEKNLNYGSLRVGHSQYCYSVAYVLSSLSERTLRVR